MIRDEILAAATAIKEARALVITCGAGMGVDSKLATFRGRHAEGVGEGAWAPIARGEETPYSMCKPRRFDEDALKAWGYTVNRWRAFTAAQPHEGYRLILGWQKPCAVFTSNIDGHWSSALSAQSAERAPLVEYHGSMRHIQCHKNCRGSIAPVVDTLLAAMTVDAQTGECDALYPSCPSCGGLQRFNVCLIADTHFNTVLRDEQLPAFERFVHEHGGEPFVVLEIGAGRALPTVRDRSESICRAHPETATLVRINLDEPEMPADVRGVSIGGISALQALRELQNIL